MTTEETAELLWECQVDRGAIYRAVTVKRGDSVLWSGTFTGAEQISSAEKLTNAHNAIMRRHMRLAATRATQAADDAVRRALTAAEFLIEEIIDREGREGMTDYDFAEQVILLAQQTRDTIREALAQPPEPAGQEGAEAREMQHTPEEWRALLNGRDDFLVKEGLWGKFVDSLCGRPSAPAASGLGDDSGVDESVLQANLRHCAAPDTMALRVSTEHYQWLGKQVLSLRTDVARKDAALAQARDWFEKANAPDDVGCDYLNGDGWEEGEAMHELVKAALSSPCAGAGEGWQLVPVAALKWLNGEAPDHEGLWFGESEPVNVSRPHRYWWRSRFRAMCAALAAAPQPKG